MLAGATIARNLRSALGSYSRSTEAGELTEIDSAVLVNSGVNYAVFNAAVLSESLDNGRQQFGEFLLRASNYYGERNLDWSCWLCEDLLDEDLQNQASAMLRRYGLFWVAEHRQMAAERIASPLRVLPYLELRRVGDFQTRLDFIHVSRQVFGLPARVAQSIYGSEAFWEGRFTAWLGYVNNRPICSAATDTASGVIGVYSVATLGEYQRQGFGESVTRHAIEQAQLESGFETSILQSTRAGMKLYRKMGYAPLGRLSVYATR